MSRQALPQTERDFQNAATKLLHLFGFITYHTWNSMHSTKGFPDVIAVKDGYCLALEFKSDKGKVKPEQETWIRELDAVPGITARILRPSDWDELERLVRA